VLPQSLNVELPDLASTLITGNSFTITWQSNNIPPDALMTIRLKQQVPGLLSSLQSWIASANFVPITTVVTNTSNSGTYTWSVALSVPAGSGYVFDVIW
jgi:hypothetical protein